MNTVTKIEFNQWVAEMERRLFFNELMDAMITNFAGNSAQLNKTSGNGEEATREPDLNSAARKPMQ